MAKQLRTVPVEHLRESNGKNHNPGGAMAKTLTRQNRAGFTIMTLLCSLFVLQPNRSMGQESSDAKTIQLEKDTVSKSELPVYQLDAVVITANRYEKSAFAVPYAVSILSANKFQREGAPIIADLLRNLGGVDVSDAGPFRTRPAIRGLGGSRILILVDGQRLNDTRENTFSGAELSLVNSGQVERVEILRGSNSVLYGSNAMAGIVNIITQRPPVSRGFWLFSGSFTNRYSTADQQAYTRLALNLANHRWRFTASGDFRRASNYHAPGASPFKQGREIRNSNLRRSVGIDFAGSYALASHHALILETQSVLNSGIGFPETPNPTFPVGISFPYHDRSKIALTYEGKKIRRRLAAIRAIVYGQKNKKDLRTTFSTAIPNVPFPGATLLINDTNHTFTSVLTLGASFQEIFTLSSEQTLTWGTDYYREMIDGFSRSFAHTKFPGFSSDKVTQSASVPKNHLDAFGLYVQDDIKPLEHFSGHIGARLDWYRQASQRTEGYNDIFTSQPILPSSKNLVALSGSMGILYQLTGGVRLSGNVGSGFRIPNLVEKFFSGTQDQQLIIPNLGLDPEKNLSFDLGVKFRLNRFAGSFTAFHNQLRDFIELRATGDSVSRAGQRQAVWRYANISRVRFYGVEAEVETNLPGGFFGFGNAAYLRGDNLSTFRAIYVAPAKIVLGVGWKSSGQQFEVEVNDRFIFDQRRVDFDPLAVLRFPTSGFNRLNLRTSYNWRRWTLTFNVNNLTNQTYSEPLNAASPFNPILEPGLNYLIGLTTRF